MLHSRRLFLLLASCLIIISLSQIAAQDETPTVTLSPTGTETPIPTVATVETVIVPPTDIPSPTITLTPAPTEVPSPLPTLTTTDTATIVNTVVPSETPTASETSTEIANPEIDESVTPTPIINPSLSPSPSATITPYSSATASLTPTITSMAASKWKILFTDNFDTEQLMLWKLGLGWGLTPSETGFALQAKNSDEPVTFVYNTLGDASVQMRVLLSSGTARLNIRESANMAYSLLWNVKGGVSLLRGDELIGTGTILPTPPGVWHTIGLMILGNKLTVTIDGIVIIEAQDNIQLPPGTFSVSGIHAETLLIDDVAVFVPINDVPLPTPVTTPTIQFTPTLSSAFTNKPTNIHNNAIMAAAAQPPTYQTAVDATELIARLNFDTQFCPAGRNYVITLTGPSPYTLQNPISDANYDYGPNALPVIRCDVTIKGNGKVIQRSSTASTDFRIFGVASTGKLTLDNVGITNGKAKLIGGSGILSIGGAVVVTNGSIISGNTLAVNNGLQILGAGIYSYQGFLDIDRSTITGNSNNSIIGDGGGIAAITTALSLNNSTITNNTTARYGGGIYIISSYNTNLGTLNIRSNTAASNTGTGVYINSSVATSVTDSCIVGNPATSFVNLDPNGNVVIATDNWWGSVNGPNTGGDTTNGATFVNSSNYKQSEPTDCTGLAISNYGAYVIVSGTSAQQDALTRVVSNALFFTAGALTHKFKPALENYRFEADPTAFKQVMLGADQNQIGFVFADLSTVSIPPNENWPSGYNPSSANSVDRVNPLLYGRVCPFFINLSPGNGAGTTPDNISNLLPGGTNGPIQQLIDNKQKGALAHEAIIVCDLNQALTNPVWAFSEYTAIYNFGLVYLYENGGLVTGSATYYGAFDNSNYGATIKDSASELIMGNLEPTNNFVCSGNSGNYVPLQIAINLNINCDGAFGAPAIDWIAGQRGWGSAAPANNVNATTGVQADIIRSTCGYQQNPIDVYPWRTQGMNKSNTTRQEIEYTTTAADMFLNWVYSYQFGIPTGFQEVNWEKSFDCSANFGFDDSTAMSGTARFNWMENTALTRTSFMR